METKQELINAVISVKSGNQEAFNYIYQSTYKSAYYVALKYMKNDQDAQDVVQDSYIKIMNNISSLQDPKSFNSWLSMIVANTALNVLKKKKPELFSDISTENDEGEAFEFQIEDEREINNPEVAYTKQETSEIVNMLLDGLSPEQKMAIIMFHFEGNSITNIASAMGCNENTVKSRLNQGRKKLKESCEDLQKKGYRLYNVAPVSLLVMLLGQELSSYIAGAAAVAGATAGVGATVGAGAFAGGDGALASAGAGAYAGGTGVASMAATGTFASGAAGNAAVNGVGVAAEYGAGYGMTGAASSAAVNGVGVAAEYGAGYGMTGAASSAAVNGVGVAAEYGAGYGMTGTASSAAVNGVGTAAEYGAGYGMNGNPGTAPQNIPGNNSSGSGAGTNATSKAASAATKTGLSVGAKAAIIVATMAAIAGIIFLIVKPKDKDKKLEPTTEVAIETSTDVITEVASTEEITEEVTTEVAVDEELVARSKAFYEILVTDEGIMKTREPYVETNEFNTNLYYTNIRYVDFNGDGYKQLVIADGSTKTVTVYDYLNGAVTPILEASFDSDWVKNWTYVHIKTKSDGSVSLIVSNATGDGSIMEYIYDNGTMVGTELLPEGHDLGAYGVYDYYADGSDMDCVISCGEGNSYATLFYETYDLADECNAKIRYDIILEELVTSAGIDTSEAWKKAYALKIQDLKEEFYSQNYSGTQNEGSYYSYSLIDINGDEIPELIGSFRDGWDGHSSFMMTCSRYGTYDCIKLSRPIDMSTGFNYVNVENGCVRTNMSDMDYDGSSRVSSDAVYQANHGCFDILGRYEYYFDYNANEESFLWFWKSDLENHAVVAMENVGESSYQSNANSYAGTTNIDTAFEYVNTVDEIEALIAEY